MFTRADNLKRHQIAHGSADKICALCGKGFTRVDYLKKHLLTHSRGPSDHLDVSKAFPGLIGKGATAVMPPPTVAPAPTVAPGPSRIAPVDLKGNPLLSSGSRHVSLKRTLTDKGLSVKSTPVRFYYYFSILFRILIL